MPASIIAAFLDTHHRLQARLCHYRGPWAEGKLPQSPEQQLHLTRPRRMAMGIVATDLKARAKARIIPHKILALRAIRTRTEMQFNPLPFFLKKPLYDKDQKKS